MQVRDVTIRLADEERKRDHMFWQKVVEKFAKQQNVPLKVVDLRVNTNREAVDIMIEESSPECVILFNSNHQEITIRRSVMKFADLVVFCSENNLRIFATHLYDVPNKKGPMAL